MVSEYKKFSNYKSIIGVDEAGRGPIAGPVVAAAVILPDSFLIPELDDSKKLSVKIREKLYELIKEKSVDYSIFSVGPTIIDKINILQATFRAMDNAINDLNHPGDFILVDGSYLPSKAPDIELKLPAKPIIKGDEKYFCVAAASILAKVYRDNLMKNYALKYQGYGFESNKGYPTIKHKNNLKKLGPSAIHRRSYKPVREIIGKNN
ncbi:MAG: ribonuclease HII [Candidatus Cloacimonetes bacterium]|nr:ribonuclease HII [Candidatus Cloacimonadota bacterium]MBS3766788.1 ribonuclease HII [Candidatus Cloacimonadota bacterium]